MPEQTDAQDTAQSRPYQNHLDLLVFMVKLNARLDVSDLVAVQGDVKFVVNRTFLEVETKRMPMADFVAHAGIFKNRAYSDGSLLEAAKKAEAGSTCSTDGSSSESDSDNAASSDLFEEAGTPVSGSDDDGMRDSFEEPEIPMTPSPSQQQVEAQDTNGHTEGLSDIARFRDTSLIHPDVPEQLWPLTFQQGWREPVPPPARNMMCGERVAMRSSSIHHHPDGDMRPLPLEGIANLMSEANASQPQFAAACTKHTARHLAWCAPTVDGSDLSSGTSGVVQHCGFHASSFTEYGGSSGRTTLKLHNLPNSYTRDMLIELLEEQGFRACFDFIYLPIEFKRKCGLGYAFVNMTSHGDASRALKNLQGFQNWKGKSQKRLQVSWSNWQGLEANVDRFRNNYMMHPNVPERLRPMIFNNGMPVILPPPTTAIPPLSGAIL